MKKRYNTYFFYKTSLESREIVSIIANIQMNLMTLGIPIMLIALSISVIFKNRLAIFRMGVFDVCDWISGMNVFVGRLVWDPSNI